MSKTWVTSDSYRFVSPSSPPSVRLCSLNAFAPIHHATYHCHSCYYFNSLTAVSVLPIWLSSLSLPLYRPLFFLFNPVYYQVHFHKGTEVSLGHVFPLQKACGAALLCPHNEGQVSSTDTEYRGPTSIPILFLTPLQSHITLYTLKN